MSTPWEPVGDCKIQMKCPTSSAIWTSKSHWWMWSIQKRRADEPSIALSVYFRILQHSVYRRRTIMWRRHMSLTSLDLTRLIPTLSDQFRWRLYSAWPLSNFTTQYYFTAVLLSPNLKATRLPQILSIEILHFWAHWHTGAAKQRGRVNKKPHWHRLSGITVQSHGWWTILTW